MKAAAVGFVALVSMMIPSAYAAPGDFVVVKAHLDQDENLKSITDELNECIHDATCNAVINAAAAYVGVDASTVTSALVQVTDVRQAGDEEKYISYVLPAGYEYCHSNISLISIVPKTGDRASLLAANAYHDRINAMTWTPVQPPTEGRSWVEANITLIGVRSTVAQQYRNNGQCNPNVEHEIVRCRGGEGTNRGQPSCGNTND